MSEEIKKEHVPQMQDGHDVNTKEGRKALGEKYREMAKAHIFRQRVRKGDPIPKAAPKPPKGPEYLKKVDSPDRKARRLRQIEKGMIQ